MKFFKSLTISLMLALISVSATAVAQSTVKKASQKKVTVTLVRWPYT